MSFNPFAALLGCLGPPAIAVTFGLWLALLGWLGLPLLLKWLRVPADATRRVVRFVTPVSSWAGSVAALVVYYLGLFGDINVNPWTLLNLNDATLTALFEWWFLIPLVWLVLTVEGLLVLLVYFGLPSALRLLGGAASHNAHYITGRAVNVLLLIGILAGLVGHGWPIWTAIVEPRSLWEHTKVGHFLSPLLCSFAPLNLVLMVCLPGWLKVDSDEHAGIAKGIVVGVVIAGLVGSILSTLYIRRYWW